MTVLLAMGAAVAGVSYSALAAARQQYEAAQARYTGVRRTHDCVRHGTTTLVAAPPNATATVTAGANSRRLYQESRAVAVVGSVAVFGLGQVLQATVGFLGLMQPWLFNSHWDAFLGLFSAQVAVGDIVRSLAVQLPSLLVFGGLALLNFRRKDVLS